MARKNFNKNQIGVHFGKHDWDRCGLFIDSGYLIGDKYKSPKLCNRSVCKGKQASIQLPKENNGYFEKFRYVNDKYVDAWKKQLTEKTKKKWQINGCTKQHATPGDNFGTFTENYEAFSPLERAKTSRPAKPARDFVIIPAKKGGPGYANITLSQWPYISNGVAKKPSRKELKKIMHVAFHPQALIGSDNPYATQKQKPRPVTEKPKPKPSTKIFHMAYPKKPGNNHDGCFDPFPKWSPPKKQVKAEQRPKYSKRLQLWGKSKSFYTMSIISHKIKSACNGQNYQHFKPITYPRRMGC